MGYSVLVGLVCAAIAATVLPAAALTTPDAGSDAERSSLTTMTTAEFERALLARTNARRENRGCRRALKPNSALILAARLHNTRMADQRILSHRLGGEAALGTRVREAGYTSWRIVAENLAAGHPGPREVFRAWRQSPGHRANLDNCRLRDAGIAVTYRNGTAWVTADFGRRS